MDGSHRQAIISSNIKWPNGLTLDLMLNRIYWVDAKLNIISSSNLDGSDRRVVLYSAEFLRHPFSITVFEDYVYWTDWDKAAVFKANKFNGSEIQAITAMRMVSVMLFLSPPCSTLLSTHHMRTSVYGVRSTKYKIFMYICQNGSLDLSKMPYVLFE